MCANKIAEERCRPDGPLQTLPLPEGSPEVRFWKVATGVEGNWIPRDYYAFALQLPNGVTIRVGLAPSVWDPEGERTAAGWEWRDEDEWSEVKVFLPSGSDVEVNTYPTGTVTVFANPDGHDYGQLYREEQGPDGLQWEYAGRDEDEEVPS
jgi:hypothetical protein